MCILSNHFHHFFVNKNQSEHIIRNCLSIIAHACVIHMILSLYFLGSVSISIKRVLLKFFCQFREFRYLPISSQSMKKFWIFQFRFFIQYSFRNWVGADIGVVTLWFTSAISNIIFDNISPDVNLICGNASQILEITIAPESYASFASKTACWVFQAHRGQKKIFEYHRLLVCMSYIVKSYWDNECKNDKSHMWMIESWKIVKKFFSECDI